MGLCDLGPHFSVAKDWVTGGLTHIALDGWEDGREFTLTFANQDLKLDQRSLAHATLKEKPALVGNRDTVIRLILEPLEYLHLCYEADCEGPFISFTTEPPAKSTCQLIQPPPHTQWQIGS